jgi:hypothetical protein
MPDWTADGYDDNNWLGYSVNTAGDVNGDGYDDVIVGEPSLGEEGRAFVYHGSASGLSATADWTGEDDAKFARFGWSVATAGDVNGDGYDDVIVGARNLNKPGKAFVHYGSASGLSTRPDWTVVSDRGDGFGHSVATAGDVNGDGYDDVVVGDPGSYFNDEGRVFVYHGSATGLSATADWTAEGNQVGSGFGGSVGTAGDVNGDGYDDVVIGADHNQYHEYGDALVYHGSASGLSATAAWRVKGDQEGDLFGHAVATAGDVNGDGYDDVLVGAPRYENRIFHEGGIVVYFGSASGLATAPYWTAESDQSDAQFGWSVATAGDVNGDGYDDGIGGAVTYDVEKENEGMAVVFHGRETAPPR